MWLDAVRDSVTDPVPNEATSYFPKFLSRPAFGSGAVDQVRQLLLRRIQRVLSTASDLVLHAGRSHGSVAAARHYFTWICMRPVSGSKNPRGAIIAPSMLSVDKFQMSPWSLITRASMFMIQ
jgi:hypothetical protein